MKKRILIFIICAAFFCPQHSFAWGATGHQLVAELAFHFLDDTTRQKVTRYLKKMTIEEAATWMDDMRSNTSYNYMKPWHFIDIDSGKVYAPATEYNIVTVLNAAINELKHKQTLSFKEINNDLLIIFHLVGDLEQPLHVGYDADRGGNDVLVSFLTKKNRTNLHSVWDNGIIDTKKINMDSCLQLYKNYTPDDLEKVKQINLLNWVRQSRSYLGEVYNFTNGFIDEAYLDKNTSVVEQQLLFGGLRLAGILQSVFK